MNDQDLSGEVSWQYVNWTKVTEDLHFWYLSPVSLFFPIFSHLLCYIFIIIFIILSVDRRCTFMSIIGLDDYYYFWNVSFKRWVGHRWWKLWSRKIVLSFNVPFFKSETSFFPNPLIPFFPFFCLDKLNRSKLWSFCCDRRRSRVLLLRNCWFTKVKIFIH